MRPQKAGGNIGQCDQVPHKKLVEIQLGRLSLLIGWTNKKRMHYFTPRKSHNSKTCG